MIEAKEIREIAEFWKLPVETIERDYALGWVLWGISNQLELSNTWVFKGGTCIKKCFANTHRYSEDLDFSILADGPYKPDELSQIFVELLNRTSETSKIKFVVDKTRFELRPSNNSTEGRVYFIGPRQTPSPIRIKLDITADELVVRPPVLRRIDHPYSDELPDPKMVRCYNLEELFAEKIRAMSQRNRPRDLYDIIFLSRRSDIYAEPDLISEVLEKKCLAKEVEIPRFENIMNDEAHSECKSEWENMLGHQLGILPAFENHWEDLERFFDWLEGKEERALQIDPEEVQDQEKWKPPPIEWERGQSELMEPIRFAAVNRLLILLGYKGSTREVEPYSLRTTQVGSILFYALRHPQNFIRAYRIDRIQSIEVLPKPFNPQFPVEFTPDGRFSAPLQFRRRRSSTRSPRRSRKQIRSGGGIIYIIQCPYCEKTFRRTTRDFNLRKHKLPNSGFECPVKGSRGYMIETRYG